MGNGITGSIQTYNDLSGLSSNSNINALLGGTRWGSGNGSTVALTYSFIATGSQFQSNYTSSQEYRNSQSVSTAQKTAIRTALAAWARVANITFTEVSETTSSVGDIRFGIFNGLDDDYGAWAYYPDSSASGGDVWYHRNTLTYNLNPGGYFIQLSIHELGHALGLKHSFSAGDFSSVTLPSSTESDNWTVMSYTNADYVYTITPQPYDIQAIQYLYGANTTTTAGADTYTLSLADQTIWDYGGTDTLSGSSSLTYTIDLRAGQASYGRSGSSTARYYIMSDTTIENASGSTGNDTITGNDADNTLTGGGGSDVLDGGAGTDTAVFDGAYANYTVTQSGSTITVRDLRTSSATDTLSNIEWLSFSDQRIAGSAATTSTTTTTSTVTTGSSVYRFYNRTNGAHFFTASSVERDSLIATNSNLNYEGAVFSAISSSATNATSVYRFYNSQNNTHFYTVSATERDSIIANLSTIYSYEGVAYQAYTSSTGASITGATALYRFYNTSLGSHFFTASLAERDSVINNLSATYSYEGIAYYVASASSSGGAPEPSGSTEQSLTVVADGGAAADLASRTASCGCAACRALRAQSAASEGSSQSVTAGVDPLDSYAAQDGALVATSGSWASDNWNSGTQDGLATATASDAGSWARLHSIYGTLATSLT